MKNYWDFDSTFAIKHVIDFTVLYCIQSENQSESIQKIYIYCQCSCSNSWWSRLVHSVNSYIGYKMSEVFRVSQIKQAPQNVKLKVQDCKFQPVCSLHDQYWRYWHACTATKHLLSFCWEIYQALRGRKDIQENEIEKGFKAWAFSLSNLF